MVENVANDDIEPKHAKIEASGKASVLLNFNEFVFM